MSDKVLLTGASGFIAKHVLLNLLDKGYHVIGTVRTAEKADQLKQLMSDQGADISRLSFELLDLTKEDGWLDVAKGCRYIQHIASPFPMKPSNNREALVPAAKDGALRVLNAAIEADVERYIFTASVVSMMYREDRHPEDILTEKSWTDPEWDILTAYVVSKTRAEKAVWQRAEEAGYKHAVTSIHPGLVLGPALDQTIGTSLEVISQFLRGHYPVVPRVSLPIVDVRDVADLHVLSQTKEQTAGRRLIAAEESLSFLQISTILKKQFPKNWRLPFLSLPDFIVRRSVFLDPALKAILPDLGRSNQTDSDYVTDLTGHVFRSSTQSVRDAAQSLYDHKIL